MRRKHQKKQHGIIEKKKKRDPISSLFTFLFTAVFDGVKYFVRKVIIISTFVGLIYLSAQMIFQYNPTIKVQFDEKKAMIKSLLVQAENMMSQLEQISASDRSSVSTSSSKNQNIGGISITPEMISSVMASKNAATQHSAMRQSPEAATELQTSISTNIPTELQPFLNALKNSKNYPKYLNMMSADKVGSNGEGATTILGKALKTNNQDLKYAALESLNRIGTKEALAIVNNYKK